MKLFLNLPGVLNQRATRHGMALFVWLAVLGSSCFMSSRTEAKSICIYQSGKYARGVSTHAADDQGEPRPKREAPQSDYDNSDFEEELNQPLRNRNLEEYDEYEPEPIQMKVRHRDLASASDGSVPTIVPESDLLNKDDDYEDKLLDVNQKLAQVLDNDTAVSHKPGEPGHVGDPFDPVDNSKAADVATAATAATAGSGARHSSGGAGVITFLFIVGVYTFWIGVLFLLFVGVTAYHAPLKKNKGQLEDGKASGLQPTDDPSLSSTGNSSQVDTSSSASAQ